MRGQTIVDKPLSDSVPDCLGLLDPLAMSAHLLLLILLFLVLIWQRGNAKGVKAELGQVSFGTWEKKPKKKPWLAYSACLFTLTLLCLLLTLIPNII